MLTVYDHSMINPHYWNIERLPPFIPHSPTKASSL